MAEKMGMAEKVKIKWESEKKMKSTNRKFLINHILGKSKPEENT